MCYVRYIGGGPADEVSDVEEEAGRGDAPPPADEEQFHAAFEVIRYLWCTLNYCSFGWTVFVCINY